MNLQVLLPSAQDYLTRADLETGTLVVGNEGEGAHINLPARILDPERFKAILLGVATDVAKLEPMLISVSSRR